jgi:hypothetical protein
MNMKMASSLSPLPMEVTYRIFRFLDRPSKLSLGLTSPHFLHMFAQYYHLDRYRGTVSFDMKLGLAQGVSWSDSVAQPAIIRWLAMTGGDDIDDPESSEDDEPEGTPYTYEEPEGRNILLYDPRFNRGDTKDRITYEETEGGKEDVLVEYILTQAMHMQFGLVGDCIFCAECYRYMRIKGPNAQVTPWAKEMIAREL